MSSAKLRACERTHAGRGPRRARELGLARTHCALTAQRRQHNEFAVFVVVATRKRSEQANLRARARQSESPFSRSFCTAQRGASLIKNLVWGASAWREELARVPIN